jgi:hypothetical protein
MLSGTEIGVTVFSMHWFCDLFLGEVAYAVDDSFIYLHKQYISPGFLKPL